MSKFLRGAFVLLLILGVVLAVDEYLQVRLKLTLADGQDVRVTGVPATFEVQAIDNRDPEKAGVIIKLVADGESIGEGVTDQNGLALISATLEEGWHQIWAEAQRTDGSTLASNSIRLNVTSSVKELALGRKLFGPLTGGGLLVVGFAILVVLIPLALVGGRKSMEPSVRGATAFGYLEALSDQGMIAPPGSHRQLPSGRANVVDGEWR